MTQQVLNSGLTLAEGVVDKGNLDSFKTVLARTESNFNDLYSRVTGLPGTYIYSSLPAASSVI